MSSNVSSLINDNHHCHFHSIRFTRRCGMIEHRDLKDILRHKCRMSLLGNLIIDERCSLLSKLHSKRCVTSGEMEGILSIPENCGRVATLIDCLCRRLDPDVFHTFVEFIGDCETCNNASLKDELVAWYRRSRGNSSTFDKNVNRNESRRKHKSGPEPNTTAPYQEIFSLTGIESLSRNSVQGERFLILEADTSLSSLTYLHSANALRMEKVKETIPFPSTATTSPDVVEMLEENAIFLAWMKEKEYLIVKQNSPCAASSSLPHHKFSDSFQELAAIEVCPTMSGRHVMVVDKRGLAARYQLCDLRSSLIEVSRHSTSLTFVHDACIHGTDEYFHFHLAVWNSESLQMLSISAIEGYPPKDTSKPPLSVSNIERCAFIAPNNANYLAVLQKNRSERRIVILDMSGSAIFTSIRLNFSSHHNIILRGCDNVLIAATHNQCVSIKLMDNSVDMRSISLKHEDYRPAKIEIIPTAEKTIIATVYDSKLIASVVI